MNEPTDCYMVTVVEPDRVFLVKHFPDRDTRRPCCRLKVTVTDADRAEGGEHDPHGTIRALLRASGIIEKKHAS